MSTIPLFYRVFAAFLVLVLTGSVRAAAPDTGSVNTLYQQFFLSGGPIVWFILLPMSFIAIYFTVDLIFSIRRSRLLPPGRAADIATHAMRNGIHSLLTYLAGSHDLLSRSTLRGLERGRQLGGSPESVRQFAAEALRERGLQLMRKAQWCQIIGSVAPMVGLFGTVFGMIRAFNLLAQGGEGPRYDLLADAISIALVTTFWGLLVAIPALSVYGIFQSRIEAFVSEAAMETDALLGRLFEDRRERIHQHTSSPEKADTSNAAKQ